VAQWLAGLTRNPWFSGSHVMLNPGYQRLCYLLGQKTFIIIARYGLLPGTHLIAIYSIRIALFTIKHK